MPEQTNSPNKPKVFISYSHKDEVWKDRLIPQLKALEQAGRIAVWDDRKIDGGDQWYPEIKEAMEIAAVAVCLISPDYLSSDFCVKEEVPYLLDRCEKDGLVFLPLLLRPCVWKAFDWLKERQMLPRDGKTIAHDFKDDWDTPFGEVANYIFEIADDLRVKSFSMPAPAVSPWSPPEQVETTRLPVTGSDLFGRQKELALLDDAWVSQQTHLISFIAWGGVGKTTLVNKWLERMDADNYRGAQRVYAWSFYSQGTSDRAASADQFINAALGWFGDTDPLAGSPWDKGERLAQLVRQKKTLLLLDGMEPLQSAHNHERGKIKDPALATLIEELARENNGLCVITTREKIADLDEYEPDSGISTGSGSDRVFSATAPLATPPDKDSVQQINLELLSPEAGRALLRVGGVRGTDAELERATEEFGCHALALNLLATYLQDIPGYSVSAASQIPDLDVPEAEGKHPRRVIAAFEQKFGEGPELEVLRLLGLFDRPADGASIKALRKAPKIAGLTDHIGEADEANWLRALQRLRKSKLLAIESHHDPDGLDAHPLVREHFRQQMKRDHLDAWREANLRLYEHLTTTTKEFPDTMEEMALLFSAVVHGCEAGKHQQAFADVYRRRIQRGNEFFSTKKLGAFGAELAVLTGFFEAPWRLLVAGFTEAYQADALNLAGFRLHALGQLQEAVEPMRAGLQANISRKDWENAAITAGRLSELYLMMGDLPQALEFARHGVALADRRVDGLQRINQRAKLADALHQTGQTKEAEDAFRQAEELQKQRQPEEPTLNSAAGYRYCDLLLDQGKHQEVKERAARAIKWAKQHLGLLDIALDNLSLGGAWLLQAQQAGADDYTQAAVFLQRAVNELRQAGRMDYLPRGLLARAELRRLTGEYQLAQADLDKAQRISERSGMKLHLTDCYLERSRLCLAMGDRAQARQHWTKAKTMVEQTGYHRRDRDLEEIARELV